MTVDVKKGQPIYEGKAKIIYETSDPERVITYFKDDATAFDGAKKGSIKEKGVVNAGLSAHLFRYLEQKGIPTHFEELVNERELLVKRLTIIQVEVVVRNIVAGSLSKRLGIEEGTELSDPVLEFYYKNDELGDPLVNEYHIRALDLATPGQLKEMGDLALSINELLSQYVGEKGLDLVDFKLEFGLFGDKILLGDEISPDTCRFWDRETRKKLDKDRFRRDLGGVEEAYQEVYDRLVGGR